VGSPEAGGGAGVAATAISGEARLGQTADDVARAGCGQREVGKAVVERGRARGRAQSGAEAAEAAEAALRR
jgi:hypothetical protein